MGDPFTIDCKHEGDFCTLYNPSGEMILKDKRCSYFIPTVSMDDIGKWKCFKSFSNAMVMQEHIIEISMLGNIYKSNNNMSLNIIIIIYFPSQFLIYLY